MSEALKKNGLQKVVDINGIKYTLQKLPFYSYLQLVDRHTNKHGVLQQSTYVKEMFEHCVVDPKVEMSDFDNDFDAAMMLANEIETFHRPKSTE